MSDVDPAEKLILELMIDGYPVPAIAQMTGKSLPATRAAVNVVLAKAGAVDRKALRQMRLRGEV